jgi:O-acetyl-ADP-ribose deacetylase (regulator of RNase III)
MTMSARVTDITTLAVGTIRGLLTEDSSVGEVVFACFSGEALAAYREAGVGG